MIEYIIVVCIVWNTIENKLKLLKNYCMTIYLFHI